ncbi:HEAT repeat domain-containing protein [Enhygromyxa salina]|uniref:HEAT repeat domain-containing protein n=1 Tax=Enhygromyxa salina TaxID=215803 RepID=UPI0011BA7781|nr:HEAT repeat domain-containing protein [Enhygromyxa salina]
MLQREIQEALASDDIDVILDGLAALKGERDVPPTKAVAAACERLIGHSDPEVRAGAIAAAGIHWAIPGLFTSILNAARCDDDMDVRVVGVRALTRYADARKDEVCRVLAAMVKQESRADLRAVAYKGLLAAEGRLTPGERAAMPEDIDALDIDTELLRRWTRSPTDGEQPSRE